MKNAALLDHLLRDSCITVSGQEGIQGRQVSPFRAGRRSVLSHVNLDRKTAPKRPCDSFRRNHERS